MEREKIAFADRPLSRPDPDALLAQAAQEDEHARSGRLKIFFGAAPGVGKTFAMLELAQSKRREGIDVVVGVLETHGRADTAARLEGLEVLPLRDGEFDLDAALLRAPQLLLVDELAHTNREGSRHRKRWQDVEELLASGIDVYSTLNVQHLESLNDVVAQITGIQVRETVPDRVLEIASEIELIDLPVPELIERLRAGKVYRPDQAARALDNFFRSSNLNALRELALRRTAEKVDSHLVTLRQAQADEATWPVAERILVAIGPGPSGLNLVRTAKRFASRLDAEWVAVTVDDPRRTAEETSQIENALTLAQNLGAEPAHLSGPSVAQAILEYARRRNTTTILVGKAPGSKLVDALIESSGDIAVLAVEGSAATPYRRSSENKLPPARELAQAAAIIVAATVLSLLLRDRIALANLVMIYLLAVVAIAMRHSRSTAIASSVLAVASFDFFCVPPFLTFAVSDTEYLLTFAVMLAVSIVISTLTVKLREQAAMAGEREARTQSLYRLAHSLAHAQRLFEAGQALAPLVSEVFRSSANVFLPNSENKIQFRRRVLDNYTPPTQEEGIAQWAFDHGQKAGRGAATLPGATALYLPLRVKEKSYGVLALEQPPSGTAEAAHLEAMLNQTAQTMERLAALELAREAEIETERERLRNSLLSAVSHDIKTPLAGIRGAASTLRLQSEKLSELQKNALLEGLEDESERLGRLVSNLLEMTRLEQGQLSLRREWCSLEEAVGACLERMSRSLGAKRVTVGIPADFPLIEADPTLLEQLLQNLIENALRHTPPESQLWIRAEPRDHAALLIVEDDGPGFPPAEASKVFDKFFRGSSADPSRGSGLGLAIVKLIAEAHGGRVRALQRAGGGARIEVELPL
jgi:two-component system sensor histidine kinase KdpD